MYCYICLVIYIPSYKVQCDDLYDLAPYGINQIENIINSASPILNLSIDNLEVKTQINDFIKNTLLPLSTSVATILSDFIINLMSVIVSYVIIYS